MKHLLVLSYLGTHYCGFQVQPNGATVQAALGAAAERIFAAPCLITGCSRTDSGVHANMYLATVEEHGHSRIPDRAVPRAMNTYLPEDISVSRSIPVPDDFSIRRRVAGKEYVYRIWNGAVRDPFLSDRAYFYFRRLDVEAMRRAARLFPGTHDFRAFMASGSDVCDTVRTVSELRIETSGDLVNIYVSADGFLYNMVRIIVGTLIEVSEGRISEERLRRAIAGGHREEAGRTAPPEGLYLNRVFLDTDLLREEC
ncbi:MAG: tRNA pseudouridine(38-40) synthase TruA [Clostridia bacterium]|nr:tRNA pseudouridine(38-40) synthase TruA [Clostridia bacterium]